MIAPMSNDDDALLEERRAAALRKVADLGMRRADLLQQAEDLLAPLEQAVVEATRIGAPRRRMQELAKVGTRLFYEWIKEADVPMRASKRTPRKKPRNGDSSSHPSSA
jgi:hypothetical protein